MPDVTKLVNATELDSNLTSVANAIRAKSGGSSALAFPSGFVSEIQSIPTGGGGGDVSYDLKKLYLHINFTNWNLESGEIGFNIVLNTRNNETDPPILFSKTYTEEDEDETIDQEIDLTSLIPSDARFIHIIVQTTSKIGSAYGTWSGIFLPSDFTNLNYNSANFPIARTESLTANTSYGVGSSSISNPCALSMDITIED